MKTNRTFTLIWLLIMQMVLCIINMILMISFLIGYNPYISRDPETNQNTCYMTGNIQNNSICIYQVLLCITHLFVCLVICLILYIYTQDCLARGIAVISLLTIAIIVWCVSLPTIDANVSYANANNVPYRNMRLFVLTMDWLIIGYLMFTVFLELWCFMIDYITIRQRERNIQCRNELICDSEPGVIVEINSIQPSSQRIEGNPPPQTAGIPVL